MMYAENSGISQYVKNIKFECYVFTHVDLNSEWNHKNVISPFHRIYIPTDGEGKVCCKGKEYVIKKGTATIIPSMTEFSYSCDESLNKYFAHVNVLGNDGLEVYSFINDVIEIYEDFSEQITKLYEIKDVMSAVKIKNLLFEILLKAFSKINYEYAQTKPYSKTIYNALNFIANNISANLKIGDVAKSLSISPITLQKKWKEEINVPIGKYIDDKIMLLSERELATGNLNVGEVADKFGFCDRFYFSRKFKEYFGLSPKRYLMNSKT